MRQTRAVVRIPSTNRPESGTAADSVLRVRRFRRQLILWSQRDGSVGRLNRESPFRCNGRIFLRRIILTADNGMK